MDIARFLHAYIDHEFEHREEIEFEHHLSHCDSCREEVAYYRTLRRTLQDKVTRKVAPVRLETAIFQALEEEDSHSWGWFSLSLATTGALLCALGIFFWAPAVQDNLPSQGHWRGTAPVAAQTSQVPSKRRISAVIAPLSVSSSGYGGHTSPAPSHQASHASQAVMFSDQQPQRCVEQAQQNGWFAPHGNQWQGQSGFQRTQSSNLLDNLCDPPRRRNTRLLHANFQR